MTRRGSKLCWHSYRNGPIYKVHRICQHAIELWLVVLCAVGAQPDDTNWIWNLILFSVWTLRWKPANTAQMKAVVSCLKYISYRLIPLGWKNFAADTTVVVELSTWLSILLATFLIAKNLSNYLFVWLNIANEKVHFSIQIYIVGTLKRKRTSQNPVEFCADDRILYRSIDELRNLSKEKIESRLCFRHTLNRHSFKRLQLWLDLLLLFLRHNRWIE